MIRISDIRFKRSGQMPNEKKVVYEHYIQKTFHIDIKIPLGKKKHLTK